MSRTPGHPITDEPIDHLDTDVDAENGRELETVLVEDVEVEIDEDLLRRARSY
jgi:hypothetical protein